MHANENDPAEEKTLIVEKKQNIYNSNVLE